MAVELQRWRFTYEQFEQMIEAGVFREDDRAELIDGEVVRMAPLGRPHSECVRNCNRILSARAGGEAIVDVQNPLDLRPYARPEPDVMLLAGPWERYRGRLPTAEDVLLIVEVADSSLASDREVKVPLYARVGIPETWLINLIDDLIRVYREPTPEGYRVVQTLRRGEMVAPLTFPDWAIPVEEILPSPP